MHTVICAFDTRQAGQAAMDCLAQSGFAAQDMHLEHRDAHGDGTGGTSGDSGSNTRWAGLEREVAVDRSVVQSYGAFFASLLGTDDSSGHVDTYASHVERGSCVLVLDAHDEAEAQRARAVLTGLGGLDNNMMDRGTQPPLRDIVAARRSQSQPRDMATGGIASETRERAMARDEDLTHVGLRYADKDKPNG